MTGKYSVLIVAALVGMAFGRAEASECYTAQNIIGQKATSSESYNFINDGFSGRMLVCLDGDTGYVSDNNIDFARLGQRTLVGYAENGRGLEVVEVYQVDNIKGKIFITQSRIGGASLSPPFPESASVFIGDIVRVEE